MNLLTNGIKYRQDRPDSFVKLTLETENNQIIIQVSDNGIGISEKDKELIFNRFYKADKSRTGEDTSFGLGLSMVKWIAEAHRGKAEVFSKIGEGSTFTVTLPEE